MPSPRIASATRAAIFAVCPCVLAYTTSARVVVGAGLFGHDPSQPAPRARAIRSPCGLNMRRNYEAAPRL